MKRKKKLKKSKRKKPKKRIKIKKRYKKKILKKGSFRRRRKRLKIKVKAKKTKRFSFVFTQYFSKIKAFSLKNLFSYLASPIFESYYNFQRERKRKLLKAQEAKEREQERIKRARLELIKKMKEEQLKEEIYYSKELKKDMEIFLREQERETRKQKAKEQQEIIDNLRLSRQVAAFEARQNREIADLE